MNIFNNGSGNLLVDYVLPSESLDINDSGVFWPESNDPQFDLVGDFPFPSSDHRLVYADVRTSNDMQTNNQTTNNQDRKNVKGVKFLGEVTFPTGLEVDGTEFGGISGLAYDADKGVYYGLSDDRSQRNPARFYNLSIDLSDGSLNDGDITFDGVTTLLDEDGNPFAEASLDPEGIALSKNGNLFISSEGDANQLINPFVNEFSLQGKQLSELPVPEKFLPTADQSSGIRNNAAFESLAISPDGNFLYTAVEDALFQDGPRADLEQGALVRIIKYDLQTKEPVGEFVYELDPVAEAPLLPDAFKVNGLVELLALDNNGTLLALERSFSVGKGNTVKLYEVKTQGALDVSSENSLFNESENQSFEIDPAVEKRLLVDFKDLGITPDNLEGLALGPTLPDGSQSLIVASDNNFNDTQKTQFIALGLDLNTTPTVLPTVETPNTINDETSEGVLKGDSDDPAIWVNPNNPEESIVIGTLKDGGLATFNLKGEIQQTIPGEISPSGNFGLEKPSDSYKARFNNVDIIYNFPFASMITGYEPKIDIAIASDRANDSLAIFTISENGELNKLPTPELDDPAFSIFGVDDGEATAYGLATYTSPTSGKSYVFVTQADGNKVAQIELTSKLGPADEPLMEAKVVRTLELPIPEDGTAEDGQAEGLVVDKELGFLYVAMEDGAGILKFGAEPQSSNDFTVVQGSQSKEDLQQVPFSDFITFGDSLADVGNVFLITQGTEPPSPPYFNGRFSNGELVPEILAKELGLSASTPSLAGGNNYAFGSAEAGSGNSDEGFPNVGEQINSYLATDTPEATDVFFISAGSNNFFPDTNAEATAENIPTPESVLEGLTDNITTLANAGAENFIIPNLAPLGTLPSSNAAGISDQLNALSAQFNTLLDIELDELEDELGINITELDVAGEITTIQANPSKFGFTNINEPALNTTTGAVVPNPDEYFWWDAVHPTGTAYNLVAQGLIDDLPKGTTQFTDTSTSPLVPDVEGLSIYYGKDGTGYLIASSQGDSSYAVFNREGDNEYLGSFAVGDNGDIDQANETDGLDVINVPLGPEFPNGLLVVQDGANDPQNVVQDEEELENNSTNFKFVPWEGVANAFDNPLQIDPNSYDPRNPQSPKPASPEDKKLITGTDGDDLLVAGKDFKGENNILFTGAGNDEIDLAGGSKNRVNAGSGDDLIFVGSKDRVFGGAGRDIFDATDGMGGNRMSGGKGNDIFFLGKNDRALGGKGDDKFFVQSGGDNVIFGGKGADQFWIASAEIPKSANTVLDFKAGTDVIGILGSANLGIDASTLDVSDDGFNTTIAFGDDTLAVLNGVTDFDVNTSVVFG